MKTKTNNLVVYRFEYWSEHREQLMVSEKYATLDSILKGLGVPLLDTAKVVSRDALVNQFAE